MAEEQQNAQTAASHNQYYQTATALKLRLSTTALLERLELNLKGYREAITEKEDGTISIQRVEIGKPKANDQGIQEILRWAEGVLDPSVVQGNYTEDAYNSEIYRLRVSLATNLMTNLNRFGININDFEGILDSFMAVAKPYLSRLIDNKERESYAETLKQIDSSVTREKGGLRLPFGGGN